MSKFFIKLFIILGLVWVPRIYAHPHVFVDAKVDAVFDKSGFVGVKNIWTYDEIYSVAMMHSGDNNGDGKISEKEGEWFKEAILNPLEKDNFYNYILLGSNFIKADGLKNFKATFKNNKLILEFETSFVIKAKADFTMLTLVVADPTNYVQVTCDMEKANVIGDDFLEVEYFDDYLEGLTMFRGFQPHVEGLYLRFKLK